jgi:hypothetical protein
LTSLNTVQLQTPSMNHSAESTMPRPERALDPSAGPVQLLANDLRQLRQRAGNPPYRELAQHAGYSVTTLSDAAGGRRLPALPVLRAYVRACGGDPGEWEERWRDAATTLAAGSKAGSDTDDRAPYLGLAGFQPSDAEWFFGRERLVAELVNQIGNGRLLAIVGASGSGKSSLLRAGLLPALVGTADATDDWLLITPGERPFSEVGTRLGGAPPALVLVDQFEEVFTLCRDADERARFFQALLDAAEHPATRVVITLRADFYGHCAPYRRLAEALRCRTVLVGPMSDEELRHAVTGPAALAGLTVERALLTKVVADAAGQPGALPLMSHALLETWRQRQGQILTAAGYEAAGGVARAIAQTAERVYAKLDPDQQHVARCVLTRLTALGEGTEDTRRRVRRAELDFEGTEAVIDRLAAARLIVVGDDSVEIAHEALIAAWPRLRGWLTDDRDGLRTHRQLTDAAAIWNDLGRDPGALYRSTRLALAQQWAERDSHDRALTSLERAFLAASQRAELQEQAAAFRHARQRKAFTRSLAVLFVVSLVVSIAAVWLWRVALRQHEFAPTRQLPAHAHAVASTNIPEGMRLALRDYQTVQTSRRGAPLSLTSRPVYGGRLSHGSSEQTGTKPRVRVVDAKADGVRV